MQTRSSLLFYTSRRDALDQTHPPNSPISPRTCISTFCLEFAIPTSASLDKKLVEFREKIVKSWPRYYDAPLSVLFRMNFRDCRPKFLVQNPPSLPLDRMTWNGTRCTGCSKNVKEKKKISPLIFRWRSSRGDLKSKVARLVFERRKKKSRRYFSGIPCFPRLFFKNRIFSLPSTTRLSPPLLLSPFSPFDL